jgi:hypothetical protein
MRERISRRPSPAMAVAFLALLAALSGTAIALPGTATVDSGDLRNNSVRSKDVRNNNLRGGDVRNGSLRGTDVANDSLTGLDVNESTLGTVPTANTANAANTANTANAANTAGSATSADNFGGYSRVKIDQFSLGNAEARTLLTHGPFTLQATCNIVPAGNDTARIQISTNADNAAVNADNTDPDFDQVDSPIDFVEATIATGTALHDHADDASASATDGTHLLGDGLWAGTNLFGTTERCWFGGFVELG